LSPLAGGRWIFLRGLAREARHWGRAFPDAFRAALPSAEVLMPDMPGCGAAASERSPTTVAGILEAVRARVGATNGHTDGRPLGVLALSLGGMVALEWMRRHPGELAGVVLVNTSVGGLSPPWRRLQPRAMAELARAALASDPRRREAAVYRMVSARPGAATAVVADWAALAAGRPAPGTAACQLVAAARYRPVLTPTGPALVLTSACDRMVDSRCSRALARALGAELREHPTAGHDLPLDEPAWTAQQVADWVAGL
jgi:pimeloyl-ACP methyl ester carboxylesterase